MSIQGLKKFGLGESFGKASLANTAFELGRFISMSDRSSWIGEGGYRNPSEAWPDEALERGFAQTLGEEREKLGEGWLRIDRLFITVIG